MRVADSDIGLDGGDGDTGAQDPVVLDFQARAKQVRELIENQLDTSVEPASLFDIPLEDVAAADLEAARLAALVRQVDEVQKAGRSRSRTPKPPDETPLPTGSSVGSIRSSGPRASISIARALAFYALPAERRREILAAHGARRAEAEKERAARPLTGTERAEQEKEEARQKALEEARLAHSEAERLVAEEYGRLLGVAQAQHSFSASLATRRQELAERHEITIGWQRRATQAREGRGGTAEDVDTTYDELRKTLGAARDELSAALDEAVSQESAVPGAGANPLAHLRVEVEADKAKKQRKVVEEEAQRLRIEERELREERASQLLDEIDDLNQERLSLLDFLSAAKRASITGWRSAGIQQAASEARQLGLVIRYHRHATATWIASLRQPRQSLGRSLAGVGLVVVEWLLGVVALRRVAPTCARPPQNWRQRVKERDRQARLPEPSPLDRALRLLEAVRRPLEWLLLLAALGYLLPRAAAALLEFELLSVVLTWTFTGALIVDALNFFASPDWTGTVTSFDRSMRSSLRLRSLRLVGRVVVVLGLLLVITSRLVGQGTLYRWVWSTCWLASAPVFLVLIRWWRDTVFDRAERVRKKSAFENWLLEHRVGWKSFPAAMAGGVYLFVTGSLRAARNWVARFDVTRRLLAYLFRRELDRLGEERAESRLAPLPQDVFASLGPETASQQLDPDQCRRAPRSDSKRALLGRGGVFALVGERGMGKTSALRRIHERVPEAMLVDISREDKPDLARVLGERLHLPSSTTLRRFGASAWTR